MPDAAFRLPVSPRPTHHAMHLVPRLRGRRFDGEGRIDLELDAPTETLRLHGSELRVEEARVRQGEVVREAHVHVEEASETLRLELDGPVEAGEASLEIRWQGRIRDDLRGFYVAGEVAVTQFEAAHARKVFPCFDEPSFKAPWTLSIDVAEGLTAVANGRTLGSERGFPGRRIIHFEPTPPLPAYLVGFAVGTLRSSAPREVRGVPVRTWTASSKLELTDFAQACAGDVLPLLEDYFDRSYAWGKLDQLAIPNFEIGAMENAGCVTFREVVLLVDTARASLHTRRRAAEVITHELAHHWFGNLVTMAWWDDLWLKEAFATWAAYRTVAAWRPSWRLSEVAADGKARAMEVDGLESTRPIHHEVRTVRDAAESFDAVTYEKGAAILRMLEGYLGEDVYRDGVRRFVRAHEHGCATGDDLWRALEEASGEPVGRIARAWLDRAGHPVVTVDRDGDRLHLSQRRFLRDRQRLAERPDGHWPIPLALRYGDDAGVHRLDHLLDTPTDTLEIEATGPVRFVCAQAEGIGVYRVDYGAEELTALASHRDALEPIERAEVLENAWALYEAGGLPLAPVLGLLDAVASDGDPAVMRRAVELLDTIERWYVDDAHRDALRELVAERFGPVLDELGWDGADDEAEDDRLRRAVAVEAVALIARREDAVGEAVRRHDDPTFEVAPDLREAVAVAAARRGVRGAFDGLVRQASQDPDPAGRRRALVALASVEDETLIEEALELLASGTVPMQDSAVFVRALMRNRAARDRVWDRLRAEWDRYYPKWSATSLCRRVVESLAALPHRAEEVEAFLASDAAGLADVPTAVRQTRERLRLGRDVQRRAGPELGDWLAARG